MNLKNGYYYYIITDKLYYDQKYVVRIVFCQKSLSRWCQKCCFMFSTLRVCVRMYVCMYVCVFVSFINCLLLYIILLSFLPALLSFRSSERGERNDTFEFSCSRFQPIFEFMQPGILRSDPFGVQPLLTDFRNVLMSGGEGAGCIPHRAV